MFRRGINKIILVIAICFIIVILTAIKFFSIRNTNGSESNQSAFNNNSNQSTIGKILNSVTNTSNGVVTSTGDEKTENHTFGLNNSKAVKLSLSMKSGKLMINSGTNELLTASMTYNVPKWKPEIKDSNGSVRNISIKQPSTSTNISNGQSINEWDISLNKKISGDLDINLTAGSSNIDLSDTNLKSLSINMAAGNTDIRLDNNYKQDVKAKIKATAGQITVHLPKDMGVKVNVQKTAGAVISAGLLSNGDNFTNDAYGKSKFNIELDITVVAGEVNLQAE